MQIRQAKKLLKQYPPIIEIRIPIESYTAAIIDEIGFKLQERMPKGTLVVGIPIDSDFNKPFIKVNPSEINLEEFKKSWQSVTPMVLSNDVNFENIEPFSFVKIHTVLKNGEFIYRKQKDRINKMIEELLKNATL